MQPSQNKKVILAKGGTKIISFNLEFLSELAVFQLCRRLWFSKNEIGAKTGNTATKKLLNFDSMRGWSYLQKTTK